ncbi:DUF2867 domain-containing protein [Actinomadura darangshiensis]|uniref:DUF2867 domain-containing protein n=1 Tax=Actinomadura darangshiensis TaxID=705336 RepID=A0A4R5BDZ7_9ACTN|nr:DUF2867 domain-containing protein [Actinomadura darangshiensis]TDD84778.1 DUF2867 domain-containing protein [Actinomadura darangshiensis]
MRIIGTVPELAGLLAGADHVGVRTVESEATLREFTAGAMGWRPAWMRGLFKARALFARLLRLREPDVPLGTPARPEDLSFTPGDHIAFFTVTDAAEERYLVLETTDDHLTAWLAITTAPSADPRTRFELATLVKYHRRAGRFYFGVIRPFHHMIIAGMAAAGARASSASAERIAQP